MGRRETSRTPPPMATPATPAAPARVALWRRVWTSMVLRGPVVPRTDRDRAFVTVHTLLLHLRPVKVPARAIRFTHTFGLGGSSLVLITLLAITGILLMLGYQPAPGLAYESTVAIERDVLFGSLVRAVHYWSANLLVVVLLLHAARVFFTGGYHGPRQFNWVIGVSLLVIVLANAFTGYLLPWDQLSYWAVTISTGMLGYVPGIGNALQRMARGGDDIGAETLVLFYTVHTSIVPTLLVGFMAFHFWRVRKAGGVVVPPEPDGKNAEAAEPEKVLFLPHLLMREVSMALVVTAVAIALGAIWAAPLGPPANPGMSPNPAKAPWYFVGLQELLLHFHPVVAIVVIPLLAAACVLLLPYLTADEEPAGAWFLSARGRASARIASLAALIATLSAVGLHEVVSRMWPGPATWLGGGVIPLIAIGGGASLFVRMLRTRLTLTWNEMVQTAVVLAVVSFATLTVIGVWFRGAGMALGLPY